MTELQRAGGWGHIKRCETRIIRRTAKTRDAGKHESVYPCPKNKKAAWIAPCGLWLGLCLLRCGERGGSGRSFRRGCRRNRIRRCGSFRSGHDGSRCSRSRCRCGGCVSSGFSLHVDLVTAFHDDEQCHKGEGDECCKNFPHGMSPEQSKRVADKKRRINRRFP